MHDTKTADMSWIPTRKKDNKYEELLPRRTNCSSRNNKKTSWTEEMRRQAALLSCIKQEMQTAWFAIACTCLSALIPSSCARRELTALRPVSTEEHCWVASWGAVGRLQMHQIRKRMFEKQTPHGRNLPRKMKSRRFMEIHETVPFELPSDFRSWKTKSSLLCMRGA